VEGTGLDLYYNEVTRLFESNIYSQECQNESNVIISVVIFTKKPGDKRVTHQSPIKVAS
jgi:hypothetical protein